MKAQDRIIVALDYDSADEALALVRKLGDSIGFYKVGLQLFLAAGARVVGDLKAMGKKVFLDLKFYDIPYQVGNACREAVRLGADMITVHAMGGAEMIAAATLSAADEARVLGFDPPHVLAVTVLTSFDEEGLSGIGFSDGVENSVERLALLAAISGASGVVASPHEIQLVRKAVGKTNPDMAVVTPGIRRASDLAGDQKRTLSPSEAIEKGASFLVIGRPITKADDPVAAAREIIAELEIQT